MGIRICGSSFAGRLGQDREVARAVASSFLRIAFYWSTSSTGFGRVWRPWTTHRIGGGGGNSGTPAGVYTLTVTGTSGSGASALSHSVSITLKVS